jgi:hypothetical protein
MFIDERKAAIAGHLRTPMRGDAAEGCNPGPED